MDRKGFPESYDTRALLAFLRAVKSGEPEVSAPVYDHLAYDVLPDARIMVRRPDIVIVEGLNVLQVNREGVEFVSDYFDFSIYIDADVKDIEEWYVRRFFALRESVFRNPDSYFRHFATLDDDQADMHGPPHLVDDQRSQPAREHRADARAGEPDPPQGQRPPGDRGPAAASLSA